jgi:hypothetical protein
MSRTRRVPKVKSERTALRRRVFARIRRLNAGQWERCYEMIDPRMRAKGTPQATAHAKQLQAFRAAYGGVHPWHTRISLHLDGSANKNDPRPFAYVYVVWQDAAKGFHLFRERWVKDDRQWYTRVAGLVPAKAADAA